ncbi:MAG TPA: DUF5694 domain-containing protein, partial [Flavisolibacter sp.]|nr:DUF5694 domain-containing protein [Flavisolibacter sp.]
MTKPLCLRRKFSLFILLSTLQLLSAAQQTKTQLLILGCDHFSQIYKKGINHTDVLSQAHQQDLKQLITRIQAYKPDLIAVEALPGTQDALDSLYGLFSADRLRLDSLEDGRSEIYQVGFRLARQLHLK